MSAINNVLSNGTTLLQSIFTVVFLALLVYNFIKQKKIALIIILVIGAVLSVFVYGGQPAIQSLQDGITEFFK